MNKQQSICKLTAIVLSLSIIICMLSSFSVYASGIYTRPEKPVVSVESAGKTKATITIKSTSGAAGYYIYMKGPNDSAFKKVKTLKEDGSKKRSWTKQLLKEAGTYYFLVRAYNTYSGVKYKSSFSEAVFVDMEGSKNNSKKIAFVEPLQTILLDKKGKGTENKPFTYTVDTGDLVEPDIHFYFCTENGEKTEPSNGSLNEETGEFAAFRMGTVYIMAEDSVSGETSMPLKIRIVNNEYKTGEEEPIYATIIFDDDYAYIGSYPTKKITSSELINKLNAANNGGTMITEYCGNRYIHTERGWYAATELKWRVLKKTKSYALLMCDQMILQSGYNSWDGYQTGATWKKCFIRYHLNGIKHNMSGIWTYDFRLFEGQEERCLMKQSANGVKDLYLIPTYNQVKNMDASKRKVSDTDLSTGTANWGYWLLDATSSNQNTAKIVNSRGEIKSVSTYKQEYGFVPVIKVNLKSCNIIEGQ